LGALRRRIDARDYERQDENYAYRRHEGGVSVVCLLVVGGAALAFLGGPVVRAAIEIAFAIAAVVGMRFLHLRLRREAELRSSVADQAAASERRRIARDLHDGLAQDLAFIAAHGDRLANESGAEHPLAIAARRALAVSRGAIAELSAAHAPTAAQALREVARELSSRFEINVEVVAEPFAVKASDREHIVRIAREAIVNAARHGRARNVIVTLTPSQGRLVLRVRDDGIGIGTKAAQGAGGFGLLSMRERAKALGGGLTATERASGGTELELVVGL